MAFLQRISAAGALIGNPVPIADGPGYALDHNALLALGPDSVVHVTQSANSHYSENLVRLDLNGVPVLPPVAIVRANYAVSLQTVAQGGDAAVAWTAPSNLRPTRIELARGRLTPCTRPPPPQSRVLLGSFASPRLAPCEAALDIRDTL